MTKMTIGIISLLTALNVSATTLTCDESVGNFKSNKLTLELNDKKEIESFSFENASGDFVIRNKPFYRMKDEMDGTQNYVFASANLYVKYFPSKNDMEVVQYNFYTPKLGGSEFITVKCSKN